VPINCAAIPGELLESELFGYEDGSFTGALRGGRPGKFELANGGTILLDEIGDMPPDMQVKLLRVLQTGEVHRIGARRAIQTNARVIACTHVNLAHAVSKKQFRQDLFYRLNVIVIQIPSLRDRGARDIGTLAEFFMSRNSNNPGCSLSQDAIEVLTKHDWPGNVRELENTILRALQACEDDVLGPRHIALRSTRKRSGAEEMGTLQEMEQQMISVVLEQMDFNMAATAKKLGISRATLYRKVKKYQL
jgi:transcriptional regulator with PAS, ATPase and Fis domain